MPARPAPSSPASVARLDCAGRCGTAGAVRPGSLLRVRGRDMSRADEVVFLGAQGDGGRRHRRDDRAARAPRSTCASRSAPPPGRSRSWIATARCPVLRRRRSRSSRRRPRPRRRSRPAVNAPRAYVDSAQPAVLTYVVHGPGAGAGRRSSSCASWTVSSCSTGTRRRWRRRRSSGSRGTGASTATSSVDGRYAFRVTGAGLVAAGRELRARRASASRSSASSRSAAARRRSAAAAATRARTCSPAAGRRWSPPTAARSSSPATTAGPATTS